MNLVALIASAIVSLRPALSGEMIDKYADDIAAAADGDLELAMALVVVQDAESTWRPTVEICHVTGDGGRAISAFQMHRHWWAGYSRKEICESNRLAASLAASALLVLAERTGGWRGALRAYVGCSPTDSRSVRRRRVFNRLLDAARKEAPGSVS